MSTSPLNESARADEAPQPRIALDVTEADLIAYLKAKAATYGIEGLTIDIGTYVYGDRALHICFRSPNHNFGFNGESFSECEAKMRHELNKFQTEAQKLREEADRLISRAEMLEGKP